jgi:hypothetical protein
MQPLLAIDTEFIFQPEAPLRSEAKFQQKELLLVAVLQPNLQDSSRNKAAPHER